MPAIAGVSLQAARARIKYAGRDDLLLVTLHRGTSVAGVFTRSATASAPVQWSKKVAASGKARAILINSGNANTFTGVQGVADVRSTAAMAGRAVGCRESDVLIASTGVIGEPLPLIGFNAPSREWSPGAGPRPGFGRQERLAPPIPIPRVPCAR